ncbi:MAG: hypothetical protein KC484_12650 [Colwelliaceae bacterium]|nr:hypothetical protein [Colwelliaceae bacterium]
MTEGAEKPNFPADDDCCGGGACAPCVWDHYYAELEKWQLKQDEIKDQINNAKQLSKYNDT